MTKRTFALRLAMTPGIGGKTVTKVISRNDMIGRSHEEFFRLGPEALRSEYRINAKAASALKSAPDLPALGKLEKRMSELGVALVTAADAHYPAVVEAFDPHPPGVLFLYGNQSLLKARTFCVLGSRASLPADLDLIEKLTEEGVLNGEVLVTGHDRPEYQRSAVVPLRWGAPRILCLDRGLFKVLGDDLRDEAFRAARLWRYEFDPSTDLVVSPFRPHADFLGVNNQVRDRLVASLSHRLDFVSANPGGNMLRLAKAALKDGRPVRISDRSVSCKDLVALGAVSLSS